MHGSANTPTGDVGTIRGCGRADCDTTQIGPVDIFCRTHNNLLLFTDRPPIVLNVIGIAAALITCAGFYASPRFNNIIPLYLVVAGLGWVAVWVPLRRFPVAGRSVLLGWPVACILATLMTRSDTRSFEIVTTLLAIAVAVAWVIRLTRAAHRSNRDADPQGGTPAAVVIATLLSTCVAALMLWLVGHDATARHVVDLPHDLGTPLLVLAIVAGVLMVLSIAGVAAVVCSIGWKSNPRRFSGPTSPSSVRERYRQNRGTPAASARVGLMDAFSRMLQDIVLSIVDLVISLSFRIARMLVAVANWIAQWLRTVRMLAIRSLTLAIRSAATGIRVVVIPPASMLLAASFLLSLTRADVRYVHRGGLADMGLIFAFAALAYLGITISWTCLSALGLDALRVPLTDAISVSAAISIILILVGGWVLEILHLVGWGGIRAGWLTYGATVCVAVSAVWLARRGPGAAMRSGEPDVAAAGGWMPLETRRGSHDAGRPETGESLPAGDVMSVE